MLTFRSVSERVFFLNERFNIKNLKENGHSFSVDNVYNALVGILNINQNLSVIRLVKVRYIAYNFFYKQSSGQVIVYILNVDKKLQVQIENELHIVSDRKHQLKMLILPIY